MMQFQIEQNTFESRRSDLVAQHSGSYAVVDGQELVGVYPTLSEATRGGLQTLRKPSFFVGHITPQRTRVVLNGMTGLL